MNTQAWGSLIVLGGLAVLLPFAARKLNLSDAKGAGPWIEHGIGLVALALALSAGVYAKRTFIGQDLVPFFASLHPVMRYVALAAAVSLLVIGFLAIVPGRWSTVAISDGLVAVAFLVPSLLTVLPDLPITDNVRGGFDWALGVADVAANWVVGK